MQEQVLGWSILMFAKLELVDGSCPEVWVFTVVVDSLVV